MCKNIKVNWCIGMYLSIMVWAVLKIIIEHVSYDVEYNHLSNALNRWNIQCTILLVRINVVCLSKKNFIMFIYNVVTSDRSILFHYICTWHCNINAILIFFTPTIFCHISEILSEDTIWYPSKSTALPILPNAIMQKI